MSPTSFSKPFLSLAAHLACYKWAALTRLGRAHPHTYLVSGIAAYR